METFGQLQQMLLSVPARRLVLLGDVFHSDVNQDFDRFRQWRKGFPNLHIDLVLGNHDQAGRAHLGNLGVDLHDNLVLAPFYCSHAPESDSPKGFNLCGHLHPGVSLSGKAGQHVKVPCFWKGENHLCFPAFGQFTGSVAVKPKPEDLLFAITQNKIRCLEGRILV
jgi:DNA ligase-associated metallophosphoesterase